MDIRSKRDWELSESQVTSEAAWLDRRALLRAGALAAGGIAAGALLPWSQADDEAPPLPGKSHPLNEFFPAKANPEYAVKDAAGKAVELTAQRHPLTYNNFYEFSMTKGEVHKLVDGFVDNPWKVRIHGLCNKPLTLDIEDILKKCPQEERIYRFRCVEAWAMVVPWTGFSLSKLLALVEPKAEAKFVKFTTFNRPKQAPGIAKYDWYPWPYYEGLRIAEAMHPLAMIATGIYGRPLPKQNGSPLRLIVPWKYGFKSIKSIVDIELTATQPATFWSDLAAEEYHFLANVEPDVPHPRWSQASERMLGTDERRKTEPFNGYEKAVGELYTKEDKGR